MEGVELSPEMHKLIEDILIWIGFGTVVGLIAKAIMPGRDPGGAIVTLLMGVVGSVIGCGVAGFFYEAKRITPISPLGMLVAVAGAFTLLLFYRLLGGYFFVEGELPRFAGRGRGPRPAPRRRYGNAAYED